MKRAKWSVVVMYSDDEVDVIGLRSYEQARQLYSETLLVMRQEPEGILQVELIDSAGRVLFASDRGAEDPPSPVPAAPGRYRAEFDQDAHGRLGPVRYVALGRGTGPALGPVQTAIDAAYG